MELRTDEEKIFTRNDVIIGIDVVAYHFDKIGLHIDPGDTVKFEFKAPNHTVTSLHPDFGRQQRVPTGVPWFSSPVMGTGGFWLYRFDEPGVYDVVSAPQETFGMGMRIVVGDVVDHVLEEGGRPPVLMSAVLLGTGIPDRDGVLDLGIEPLAPRSIIENGSVPIDDHPIDPPAPIPTLGECISLFVGDMPPI